MKHSEEELIPQKNNTINLKNFSKNFNGIKMLRQELIQNLGDDIFTFETKQILLYNILKQIYPINKSLKLDDDSIEKACGKVITHLGLNVGLKVLDLSGKEPKGITPAKGTNTQKFCEIVIGIVKVPYEIYQSLSLQVNKDLKDISELIKWYESNPCILKYIKYDEIPKSHEDRILFDFYKRCIEERVKILNYQLYNLKDSAIEKSRYLPNWIRSWGFLDIFGDKPYSFAKPFSIHYFDCRKIDVAGHRVSEFYFDEAIKMQKLYSENPYKFYRLYFKRFPVQQHFQGYNFYLFHLPLQKDRTLIFDELIKLFKARRWISFYALALPQVEGLFSEMCSIVSEGKDLSHKSLPYKVDSVRPYHPLSNSYFDYFQYHIPKQRNRFSHIGYDEDFKLKSYDLLVDLSHLLKIFYELDNPLVKVKRVHTRRNPEDFISIKEVVDYFNLIDTLKPNQKKKIQNEIEKFEKEFLINYNIDYYCYQIIQELPKILKDFIDKINLNFTKHDITKDFEKLNLSEIKDLISNKNHFDILADSIIYNSNAFETLDIYWTFIEKYNKHLPSLKKEIKDELNRLHKEYGNILNKIMQTAKLINEK